MLRNTSGKAGVVIRERRPRWGAVQLRFGSVYLIYAALKTVKTMKRKGNRVIKCCRGNEEMFMQLECLIVRIIRILNCTQLRY